MTASRFDPSPLRRSARRLLALPPLVWLAACRAGLPPEPPGADPTDATAPVRAYVPPVDAYEVSAFAGEPAPPTTDQEHMNHGAAQADAPASPAGHEHMNHGAPKTDLPASPAGHEHMNHGAATTSPPRQSEAPR